MKSKTFSLMLAFSTMFGLAACGPEQVDPSETPATSESTEALSCPGAAGYYYCPAYPDAWHLFWGWPCAGSIEETAPFVRVECNQTCGGVECVHVGL